jgi:hypothetical protein
LTPLLNRSAQISAEIARISGDMVAILLRDLSAADALKLMDALSRPSLAQPPAVGAVPAESPGTASPGVPRGTDTLPDDPASVEMPLPGMPSVSPRPALPEISQPIAALPTELLRAVLSAATQGDAAGAMDRLAEFAARNPLQLESLRSEPALAPVRAEVEHLVSRLTSIARLDAATRLEHAAQLTEAANSTNLPGWDAAPETVLQIANRFFDSGRHDNYVRAAQVAQVLIDIYETAPVAMYRPLIERAHSRRPRPGPVTARRGWAAARRQILPRVRKLWLRAPLLILLLGWFSLGIAGALTLLILRSISPGNAPAALISAGFDLWGIGLLALVGFGFYIRVRNVQM